MITREPEDEAESSESSSDSENPVSEDSSDSSSGDDEPSLDQPSGTTEADTETSASRRNSTSSQSSFDWKSIGRNTIEKLKQGQAAATSSPLLWLNAASSTKDATTGATTDSKDDLTVPSLSPAELESQQQPVEECAKAAMTEPDASKSAVQA